MLLRRFRLTLLHSPSLSTLLHSPSFRFTHAQTQSHADSLAPRLAHSHTQTHSHSDSHSESLILRLAPAQTHHPLVRSNADRLTLRLPHIHTHSHSTHSHSDSFTLTLSHTQTHSSPDSLMLRLIMLRSAQSQTGSHSDSFTLRPTHTQTHSRSYLLTRIPTQTQARSHSNQLTLRIRRCQTCDWLALILADCGNVSSERFALAHMRPLTDIHRKMCQENEMHIWGAPRRVIGRPRRKKEGTSHTMFAKHSANSKTREDRPR